jgi:hypothetical protein
MRGSPLLLLLLPPPHAMCSVVIFNEQRTLQRRAGPDFIQLYGGRRKVRLVLLERWHRI